MAWAFTPSALPPVNLPSQVGLVGWTFDPAAAAGTNTPNSGDVNAFLVPVPAAVVSAGVEYETSAAGTLVTVGAIGLYTALGVLIAQTADQSANLNGAAGNFFAPWVGGPFPVAPPYVWVAMLQVATTAQATIRAGAAGPAATFGPSATLRCQRVSAAAGALPGSFNPAASVTARAAYLLGI